MAVRKLAKEIEGPIVTIKEASTDATLMFDFTELPAEIQTKFGPFGLGHKLGDSAAGKEGKEAVDAINKVWDGLMAGDWSVRAPAGEKVSKTSIVSKIGALSADEQDAARALLAKLGVIL
jgi:hypothetical protein